MTSTHATRRLPASVALYLLMSIAVTFLAGSSAPTPLYALYQAEWGFTPITTTVVFGVYALAVLTSLLTMGRLSDHVGRRPVLLVAIAVQAVTMLLFVTAHGVPELLLARIVQGLSTGAALGAVGAGLLDLDKVKGTIANGVAPLTGTATGGLLSGLLVQYLPAPTHLVYLVLCAVFILQAAGVAMMAETASPKAGALASLRPRFGVPVAARRLMLVAVPALVAVWALAGLYGSVGPAVTRIVVGSSSFVLGGLALFVLAGSGGVAVLVSRATHHVHVGDRVLRRHRDRRCGLRQRLPGRAAHRAAAGRCARAGGSAVHPVRGVLPGHGPASGDRRCARGARRWAAGHGPRARHRRHRAGWPRPAGPGAHSHAEPPCRATGGCWRPNGL
jgi:MFS family permease